LNEEAERVKNDPAALAKNTTAKAALMVTFTKLEEDISKKEAAFQKLQQAKDKADRASAF